MCSVGHGKYEEHEYNRRSGFPPTYENGVTSLPDPFVQNCGPRRPCHLLKSKRSDCSYATGQFLKKTIVYHILTFKKNYDGRLNFPTDTWTSPNQQAYVTIMVHLEHQGEPSDPPSV
jgi:hypothetical protein